MARNDDGISIYLYFALTTLLSIEAKQAIITSIMGYPAEDEKKYTYEDYLKTPEDKRFELIEGELIMVPSPNTAHQKVLIELGFALKQFVDKHDLGIVFVAPYDVVLSNENVFQPDILFVSKERANIITDKNAQGAPNLAIEIISPSSTHKDLVKKKRLYAKFKVKEYWIVYPEEKLVEVYILKNNSYELYKVFKEKDTLTSSLLTNFKLSLSKVFS